jgi:hypothetical protein
MKTERVIRIHFTGRQGLQLSGEHVLTFYDNYMKGVSSNNTHFFSEGKDKIIINMQEVTFIEEKTIEIEDEQSSPSLP